MTSREMCFCAHTKTDSALDIFVFIDEIKLKKKSNLEQFCQVVHVSLFYWVSFFFNIYSLRLYTF